MDTSVETRLREARVLIVGLGGLGGPIAWILAREGVGTLGLVDDDVVEESNLHRQIQFRARDLGRPKVRAMEERLANLPVRIESHETRFLPANARALIANYDLVIEGSDNFATKFLTCEAAHEEGKWAVQASSIRWVGTVVASAPRGCYVCLFESIPEGAQEGCDLAGVMGPVVGLTAAIASDLAVERLLGKGDPIVGGPGSDVAFEPLVVSVDGRTKTQVRRRRFSPRAGCPICTRFRSEDGVRSRVERVDGGAR